MAISRSLQGEILHRLADVYPDDLDVQDWQEAEPDLRANLYYLLEHDLISGIDSGALDGNTIVFAKITATGLDFLADDGGLTAILGVFTVKLHDETIRDLIAARIQGSDLPPEEKTGLLAQLRALGGESIKHLTLKLLDKGAESLPAILDAIRTSLPGG